MAFQHARRPRHCSRFDSGQRPDDGLDLLRRQPAGPQQPRVRPAEIDDGGFKADGGRSVIEDHRHPVAESLGDMGRRGGAEAPGGIGAGGGDGPAEGLEQAGRHGMARHPDGQGIEPRRGQQRDGAALPAWQDQGQRPRPELRRQDPRALIHRHQGFGGGLVREMDDQRVEARPVLRREDCCHGAVVSGVGAQAVDRLGRKGDELAGGKRCGCRGDVLFRRRQDRSRRLAHFQRPRAMKSGLSKPALP